MIRQYISSFTVMLAGIGMGFLVQMLLARGLGATDYGIYNFIFALASFVAVIGALGFETSIIRFIATLKDSPATLSSLLRFSQLFSVGFSLLAAAIVFCGLYALGYSTTYPASALGIGAGMSVMMVLLRLNSGILRGYGHGTRSVFFEIAFREFVMLVILAVFFFLRGYPLPDATSILLILLAVYALGALAAHYAATADRQTLPAYSPWPGRMQAMEWLRISFPMVVMTAARRLMQRMDIIVLGLMLPPAQVGIYALATMFADTATLASRPTLAHFSPEAARLYQQGNKPTLRRLFWHATGFIAAIHSLTALVIAVLAPFIFPYFGPEFAKAIPALWILLAGIILSAAQGPVGNLLLMTEYERWAMRITAMMAILNAIFNPLAIYFYGIEGSAFASSALIVLWNVLCWGVIIRKRILYDAA
ncbi:MAG: oligosaccharide flippase family protein [Alphaproteobacteria bacterium]|nr:oligosaccharide flippase family protein [Alphaproteobacteria bacterium]